MIISCPNCQTQYNIDENLIPAEGKKFRCVNCGNIWMAQKPVAAPATAPAPAPIIEEIPPQPIETPKEESFDEPLSVDSSDISQNSEEPSESNDEKLDEQELTAEQEEEELKKVEEENLSEQSDDDSSKQPEGEQEDKENNTDEETSPPEEQQPSEASSEFNQGAEIPDQLKQVSTSALYEMEDFSSPQSKGKSTLMAILFFIASIFVAIYIGRFYIVSKYPQLQSSFEMIGISFDVVGEGLAFKEITKEKLIVDDINYLIVEGTLINESSKVRDIPNLALSLYNSEGKLIQKIAARPPVKSLTPGEMIDFEMNVEAPSIAATQAKISFQESKGRKR